MKRLSIMIFALFCLLSTANNALACACCAEPGTYIISASKPDQMVLGVAQGMEFDKKIELFTTDAGFDAIKGLDDVQKEMESDTWNYETSTLDLVGSFINKTWKFTVKTPGGKSGTLVLPMPAQVVQFMVDTHDTKDKSLGVSLYKEMRFKGAVQSGTGIFRSGNIKPTTYFLVFQGHGNYCGDVSDYRHWHLEINGKNATYEFNGELSSGNKEETETGTK